MERKEWITAAATLRDIQLLEEIARLDGDASKSATVRRLIRDEARRRHVEITDAETEEREQVL